MIRKEMKSAIMIILFELKKKNVGKEKLANRQTRGEFDLLIVDLKLHDHYSSSICRRVQEVTINSSQRRESVGPIERLSVSVRHIVTGDPKITI